MPRKNERHEWISFWAKAGPNDPLGVPKRVRQNRLPYFGIRRMYNGEPYLFHLGGPSRMPIPDAREDEVIYGMYAEDQEDKAWAKFYDRYPPVAGTLEDLVETSTGWLAPDGSLYVCWYEGHRGLALRLCRQFGYHQELHDTSMFASESYDALIANKFIYLSAALVRRADDEREPTTRQSVVLDKLEEYLASIATEKKGRGSRGLVDALQHFRRR